MKHFLIILMSWCLLVPVVAQPTAAPLLVATYAYGSNSREANIGPLAQEMGRALGCPVRVQSFPTVPALLAAVQAGKVDVAFLNTLGYMALQAEQPGALVALARLEAPANDSNAYRACLVARRQAGLVSLAGAAKQPAALRLVFAGRHSTSGHLVPRLHLARLGLPNPEARCREVYFATSHAAVLDELRAGRADLGACGLGEFLARQSRGETNDLQLIWSSKAIPLGPVVCRAALPAAWQQALRQLLLTAHQLQPAALARLRQGWSEAAAATQFVTVQPHEYEAFFQVAAGDEQAHGLRNAELRRLLDHYVR